MLHNSDISLVTDRFASFGYYTGQHLLYWAYCYRKEQVGYGYHTDQYLLHLKTLKNAFFPTS